ncbi:unnamed protein product [Pleuronectes platessa]|uniref:Uncharacterized protein n=1 Tax=Pleuronectes platessa TaxID=8262 RepID=A0A9N7ZAM4_PLEPL|nr:unnamed protein product [Pleuronectes platessa]
MDTPAALNRLQSSAHEHQGGKACLLFPEASLHEHRQHGPAVDTSPRSEISSGSDPESCHEGMRFGVSRPSRRLTRMFHRLTSAARNGFAGVREFRETKV